MRSLYLLLLIVPRFLLAADLERDVRRADMLAGFEEDIAAATAVLDKTPESITALSHRGDAELFLARFPDAVADFEKMIALDPAQDAPHWRLGIAYYFTGAFEKASRQFEKYHNYDGHDRENGIWKFLADARAGGIDNAREKMLVYDRFDREPFPELYEMFAGKRSPSDVLGEIDQKSLGAETSVQFFAHYYIGLYELLMGHRPAALKDLRAAVATFDDARSAGNPGYMWQVARLEAEGLSAAKQ